MGLLFGLTIVPVVVCSLLIRDLIKSRRSAKEARERVLNGLNIPGKEQK